MNIFMEFIETQVIIENLLLVIFYLTVFLEIGTPFYTAVRIDLSGYF